MPPLPSYDPWLHVHSGPLPPEGVVTITAKGPDGPLAWSVPVRIPVNDLAVLSGACSAVDAPSTKPRCS